MPEKKNVVEGMMKGIPVSEGIAMGRVWVLESPWDEVVIHSIPDDDIDAEIHRYKQALKAAAYQLLDCRDRVFQDIGAEEAGIFEAHLAILKDSFFQKQIVEAVRLQKKNAEAILKVGLEQYAAKFREQANEFFQQRLDDIKDVGIRVLRLLLQTEEIKLPLDEPSILAAHHLTPSDTARFDRKKLLGFVTELGGETSHASILARSMGLPAVVGVEKLSKKAKPGDMMIVDGNAGFVYLNPPKDIIHGYEKRKKQFEAYWKRLSEDIDLPAVTADGVDISLQANVTITADVSLALRYHAAGIGLFRTELPFLMAGHLLSEDEQFVIYQSVVEAMDGRIVNIRTMDLGGDKFLPFQGIEEESNPFLGWRSIRISLMERDVFRAQLRAILRASHFGKVRIIYPMISSLSEIEEIEGLMDEVKSELRNEKVPFDENLQSGIMVEVPSVAILADRYAEYTDHFSIGTNDLIQYTLAVDRNNEKVAKFYQPLNPAILALIRNTILAAQAAKKSVSLCGEMAGNPLYTALLLGFGLREFSMSPVMLPEVKERIRAVNLEECEQLAKEVLLKPTVDEIEQLLWDFHSRINKKQTVPYMDKADYSSA